MGEAIPMASCAVMEKEENRSLFDLVRETSSIAIDLSEKNDLIMTPRLEEWCFRLNIHEMLLVAAAKNLKPGGHQEYQVAVTSLSFPDHAGEDVPLARTHLNEHGRIQWLYLRMALMSLARSKTMEEWKWTPYGLD